VIGPTGPTGPPGDSCWDLNQNQTCDLPDEDVDGDLGCDVADCLNLPDSPHQLLSNTHIDTTPADVERGDLVVGQDDGVGGTTWQRLGVGGAGEVLQTDGIDAFWGPVRNTITSSVNMCDDFIGGVPDNTGNSGTGGIIGELGWTRDDLPGGTSGKSSCRFMSIPAEPGRWGLLTLRTSKTGTSDGCMIALTTDGVSTNNVLAGQGELMLYSGRLESATTTCDAAIGIGDSKGSIAPQNGVYFRLDAGQWYGVVAVAGVETMTAPLLAADNEFHAFAIGISADSVTFTIDDTPTVLATTPPTEPLAASVRIAGDGVSGTNGSNCVITNDYYCLTVSGLDR